MQVNIVLRRDHDRGFELTRQIGLAENRFFIGGRDFLLIEPNLCIGAGARQQMLRDLLRPLIRFGMQLRLVRVRRAKHVTVHVVGGSQCVQPDGVQHLVHRLHVLLQNTVELEGLTVGQADAAVNRVFASEFINRLPLFGGDDPTRQTAAQQHRMTRLQLLFGTLSANIAVVLLVHTVETDQQEVVTFKTAGETVIQIFSNGAAQVVAFQLHALGVCQFTFDHQWPWMFFAH